MRRGRREGEGGARFGGQILQVSFSGQVSYRGSRVSFSGQGFI